MIGVAENLNEHGWHAHDSGRAEGNEYTRRACSNCSQHQRFKCEMYLRLSMAQILKPTPNRNVDRVNSQRLS